MLLSTSILPATPGGLGEAVIQIGGPNVAATLSVEWSAIKGRPTPLGPNTLDFLLMGMLVYASDKLILRGRDQTEDMWTRELVLEIPVCNPRAFNAVGKQIDEAISFLTGDLWHLDWQTRNGLLYSEEGTLIERSASVTADAVCLLSGGLDSFIGAVDWLENNPGGSLVVVGHNDPHVHGPLGDQGRLTDLLRAEYPNRITSVRMRVGQHPAGAEHSYRSRSLLFIGLGLMTANSIGPDIPLLIPENGNIAINAPLTPSRRGTCSTRTTHPGFLSHVRRIVAGLGITNEIINPLQSKTKGTCVKECLNPPLLARAAPNTVSCAKSGHRRSWKNPSGSRGCGRCVPCIFRRASLHVAGLDNEMYGNDICLGDVVITDRDKPSVLDLRAVADFLRAHYSLTDIEDILLANGGIPTQELPSSAQIVYDAMEEVRDLITAKGDGLVRSWIR